MSHEISSKVLHSCNGVINGSGDNEIPDDLQNVTTTESRTSGVAWEGAPREHTSSWHKGPETYDNIANVSCIATEAEHEICMCKSRRRVKINDSDTGIAGSTT